MIDVAALAVEQMRAARDLQAALEEYRAAREAFLAGSLRATVADRYRAAGLELDYARHVFKVANRAYEAACDAVPIEAVDGQQGLFG